MPDVSKLFPADRQAMQQVQSLLTANGIRQDPNLDYICGIYDDDGLLIATGSAFGNTLRCFAVDEQPEALLERPLADVGDLGLAGQGARHAGKAQLMKLIDGRMVEHGKSLSVVVVGATHIGVFGGQAGLGRRADDALLVQSIFQEAMPKFQLEDSCRL